ncbi:MAG: DUF4340 domain-containing protein [Holophagales bacterium]|nr:DUF4340 domain-containing protein [Holophagales bacterium]
MSTRKLLILTGVFLALLAFVVFWERHQPTSEQKATSKRRLFDLEPKEVVGLSFERPGQQPVDLSRKEGQWVLDGAKGGAADATTADGLVSDLSRLDLLGETRTSFDPKEYGLDAPKVKVTVKMKDGSSRTVLFGEAIPGADATAAAEGGRFGSVKFAPIAQLTKPYDEYRSRSLVDTPAADITRVTVARGPNRVVAVRDSTGGWRLEQPVTDLASGTFVDQLLADLAGVRATEFPAVGPADLPRIGLAPPGAEVVLEKGSEVVSRLAFGAARADAAGKLFASRDGVVMVVDDRAQESLGKELSAFREGKLLPLDTWLVTRVVFESGALRTGAEKLDGAWRSAGREIEGRVADDLLDRLSRTEVRRFVPVKELATIGLATVRRKKPVPAGKVEVLLEKAKEPIRVDFFVSRELETEKLVAVQVTGRGDTLVVDASVWDDILSLASRLKSAPAALAPDAAAASGPDARKR